MKQKKKIFFLSIIFVLIIIIIIGYRGSIRFLLTHKSWDHINYQNFTIYYPPDYKYQNYLDSWAKDRYLVFSDLLEIFQIQWPNEEIITFYVFNDFENGKKYGFNLGFAKRRTNTIYTRQDQTKGHELVHIITYHLNHGHLLQSELIDEGIAVYYDFSGRDFDNLSRAKLFYENYEVNIFGTNFRKQPYAYYYGGSFVKYLIQSYSMERFLEFYSQDKYDESNSFIKYYGKDKEILYKEWVNYLRRNAEG